MEKRKSICFIASSMKPPTNNHWRMIDFYSKKCDYVIIILSDPQKEENKRETENGEYIPAQISKQILKMAIEDSELQNVKVVISEETPVKTMMGYMGKLTDCDIILGVGKKDGDFHRYDSLVDNFKTNGDIRIMDVEENAFDLGDDEEEYSATDLRNNINDIYYLKNHLPQIMTPEHMEKAVSILQDKCEKVESVKYDSNIFENLLKTRNNQVDVLEDIKPQDITESIHLNITDDIINKSDCSLIAYNIHVDETDDSMAYNPKKNPDKAVDILMDYPEKNLKIEIFLDTPSLEWDSLINGQNKLSPEQMGQFFKTNFYHRLYNCLTKIWPSSDKLFGGLLNAIKNKKYRIDCYQNNKEKIEEDGEFRKGNIDPEKSRQKNAAGDQEYTRSGRKIVSFSDFGVKHTEDEAYFSWPEKGKEFKWSQWADWEKIHPLLRMRFQHNSYLYGLSLSPFTETGDNRGWRSYNLTLEPKLQYLTPEETSQMMDLSIVQKFLKHSIKRLNRYLSIPDEELFEKIGNPEKCTIDDIRRTKHVIKNTMQAVRKGRADTYIYTD